MHTKKIKRAGWFTAACLVVAVLALALSSWPKQLAYGGHSLPCWFNELPLTYNGATVDRVDQGGRQYGIQSESPGISVAAIRKIGTNGLPFLMYKLGRHDSEAARWLQFHATKFGVTRDLFPAAQFERKQAVTALLALSPLPQSAIFQLRQLGTNSTQDVRVSAAYVMTNSSFQHPQQLSAYSQSKRHSHSITLRCSARGIRALVRNSEASGPAPLSIVVSHKLL